MSCVRGCRTFIPGRQTCAVGSTPSTPRPPIRSPTLAKLADYLEGFLAQLRGNAATVEDRQRVLRLLVKHILIGPEKVFR